MIRLKIIMLNNVWCQYHTPVGTFKKCEIGHSFLSKKNSKPKGKDIQVVYSICTKKLPFAVRSRDGAMVDGGQKSGTWYRGVVDAADRFITRWHRGEAEKRWLRHAAEDAKSSDKEKPGGRVGGAAVLIQLSTNAKSKW